MGQKPLLVFAIALILVSSGCLGFGDDELELQENDDDKQEPVGETNMTSLEKRIIDLEAKILEYEQPKVYFQEFGGDDVSFTDGSVNLADDGNLFCWYYEFRNENSCSLAGVSYDVNGIIAEFSWESSKSGKLVPTYGNYGNDDTGVVYAYGTHGAFLNVCDTNVIDPSHGDQIITFTVYDNDGNSASASYDLDYDSVCTVEEPDNTCASDSDCPPGTICQGGVCVEDNLNVCEDGEQSKEGGMIRTCVNGFWGAGEPIFCHQDENVTNHTCVPCPEGSTNEPGDDASGSDTQCDVNHGPQIEYFYFEQDPITTETTEVCLELNFYDVDGDAITGEVIWLINMEEVEILDFDVCFLLNEYDIAVDDELRANIYINDGRGGEASAGWAVLIEEEGN